MKKFSNKTHLMY